MAYDSSRMWEGAIFTGVAVLIMLLLAWWLYFSPLKRPSGPAVRPSPALGGWTAGWLGFASLQFLVGGWWDASKHIITGVIPAGADFLWAPHIMLYSSFVISLAVAAISVAVVAGPAWREGERDPRAWFRRSPYLGAVVLASVYQLMAIPGDAIWHEIFGIDLTAWSPPHVMLAACGAAVTVCAVGVLLQARPAMKRPEWADLAGVVLMGLMLNTLFLIAVVEWELPVPRPAFIAARPIWLYPVVTGMAGFFALILARRIFRFRWSATAVAASFYLIRMAVTGGLGLTHNVMPIVPLLFLGGALLLDVIPWERATSGFARLLAGAAAFTVGYGALCAPVLLTRSDLRLTGAQVATALAVTLVTSLILLPVAQLSGQRLLGERT